MPEIRVHLSDELYRRAREHGLELSALTQAAVEHELDRVANAVWLRDVAARTPRCDRVIETSSTLIDVGDDFGA